MREITRNDFDNWWNNPVGVEFKKMLRENLDKLAYGNMTHSYARDHIGNAIETGKYEATMFYYKLSYEQFTGEEPT